MFSIEVTDALERAKNGIVIFGNVSGVFRLQPGLFLIDNNGYRFKVLGVESIHFIDREKHMNKNLWIFIETGNLKPEELIGRRLILSEE